jgi:hypothetical protein
MVLLVAEGLDDLLVDSDPLGDLGILEDGLLGLGHLQLALVEGLALHLPLGLQSGHDVLILPANLNTNARMRKSLKRNVVHKISSFGSTNEEIGSRSELLQKKVYRTFFFRSFFENFKKSY